MLYGLFSTRYDLSRILTGTSWHLARHYLTLQSSVLIHPLVTVQGTLLRNMDDRSGFLAGSCSVSVSDEASLSLGGQWTFGPQLSEYWYYPNSLYARADLFF